MAQLNKLETNQRIVHSDNTDRFIFYSVINKMKKEPTKFTRQGNGLAFDLTVNGKLYTITVFTSMIQYKRKYKFPFLVPFKKQPLDIRLSQFKSDEMITYSILFEQVFKSNI